MRPRSRLLVVALVVAASAPLLPAATGAEAAAITQVGWWSQRPFVAELPDGGFELAHSPRGPESVAAIRVTVNAVQLNFALVELVPSGDVAVEAAAVLACPTTDAWTPANAGAWNDRPDVNCQARSLALTRRQTGEWGADLAPLLSLGENSIVFVPTPSADARGFPAPFQIEFEKATLFSSAPSAEAPPATGGGTTTSPPAPRPRAVVAAPRTPPSASGPAAPPIVVEPTGASPSAYDLPRAAVPVSGGNTTSRPWWRLLLLVPLAAAVGGGAVLARRIAAARGLAGA